MEKCVLCLSNVEIPIKYKNFECYHAYKVHCNLYSRVCLHCHFQNEMKCCFFCNKKAKSPIIEFEIDYDYISKDYFSIYTCPFCHQMKGNHMDLVKHVVHCHLYKCACSAVISNTRDKIKAHKHTCSACDYCLICEEDTKVCRHKTIQYECILCKEKCSKEKIIEHYSMHIKNLKLRISTLKDMLHLERSKYNEVLCVLEDLYDKI